MNGIAALTNLAVMCMVDEDAELLFGILEEYKKLDRAYWTAQSQINALETETKCPSLLEYVILLIIVAIIVVLIWSLLGPELCG